MTKSEKKKISVVIPVFNEQTNIPMLHQEMNSVLAAFPYTYEFIFVDDGSTDGSLAAINELATKNNNVFFIELSRNFGHQYALKAGLDVSNGDCVVSMDCDLQHPPEVVSKLITKWEEGFDVVYTRRRPTKNLSWLKRKTSSLFYTLMDKMLPLA